MELQSGGAILSLAPMRRTSCRTSQICKARVSAAHMLAVECLRARDRSATLARSSSMFSMLAQISFCLAAFSNHFCRNFSSGTLLSATPHLRRVSCPLSSILSHHGLSRRSVTDSGSAFRAAVQTRAVVVQLSSCAHGNSKGRCRRVKAEPTLASSLVRFVRSSPPSPGCRSGRWYWTRAERCRGE